MKTGNLVNKSGEEDLKYNFIIQYNGNNYTHIYKYDLLNKQEPLRFNSSYKPINLSLKISRYLWKLCNSHQLYIHHGTKNSNSSIAYYKIKPYHEHNG